jgi:hypothetical protein
MDRKRDNLVNSAWRILEGLSEESAVGLKDALRPFRDRLLAMHRALRPAIRLKRFSSYEDYIAIQEQANKVKLERVWVSRQEMESLIAHIRRSVPGARFGLCHGVRNGWEVAQFREGLGIEVIGTEISETANRFPHVIQWDFHQVKPEWLGSVDFVYSNSLDHSFDPASCLDAWVNCLATNGRVLLHWSPEHDVDRFANDGADSFQASRKGYVKLITKRHCLLEVLEMPGQQGRCVFVVARASSSPTKEL